jgi:hypothetical protein
MVKGVGAPEGGSGPFGGEEASDTENGVPKIGTPRSRRLLPELKLIANGTVPLNLVALEVIEQAPPLSDKIEQPVTGGIVVRVLFQMLGEALNALCKDGDLDFGRPGIVWAVAKPIYDVLLLFFCDHRAVGDLFRLCHAKEETAVLCSFVRSAAQRTVRLLPQ